MQVELLRVLQKKISCGSHLAQTIDVPIVAATHKDLEEVLTQGTFPEDLHYRLYNIILKTSPLYDMP